MSGLFDGARSPGVIGVVLGVTVLLAFGGLVAAIFDGRLNGDNAYRLKQELFDQSLEISYLEKQIAEAEEMVISQMRSKEVFERLEQSTKTLSLLEAKASSLNEKIEEKNEKIAEVESQQVAYRDDYRRFERTRALGEKLPSLTLRNGKELKNLTIKEVMTDKVRFTTEFGSVSANWDELPESWRERFQIGEGELEEYSALLKKMQSRQSAINAEMQAARSVQLREIEVKRRLARVGSELTKKEKEIQKGQVRLTELRRRATEFRDRFREARLRGRSSSHENSAKKLDREAERLDFAIRKNHEDIEDLKVTKRALEKELRDFES